MDSVSCPGQAHAVAVPAPHIESGGNSPSRDAFGGDAVATSSLEPRPNPDNQSSSSSDESEIERLRQETHAESSALTIDPGNSRKLLIKNIYS